MNPTSGQSPYQPGDKPRAALTRVPFHHAELETVNVDGKPFLVFDPIVKSLGLDCAVELAKLQHRTWANFSSVPIADANSTIEAVTVSVATFLMWLATVDEREVAEHARPMLITFQTETAGVLQDYWSTDTVTPRYDATEMANVIAALAPVVDPGWLDAKGRQLIGMVLGEVPEHDPATQPLTVSIYLAQAGVRGADARKMRSQFGKLLKARYRAAYGSEPPVITDLVDRHMVTVAQYQEQHRHLFDDVWRSMNRLPGGSTHPKNRRA